MHVCAVPVVHCVDLSPSLSDGTLTGSFSLCTREGLTTGSSLADYPLTNITKPLGKCVTSSDCNTAGGEYCNRQDPSSACACAPATGQDSCTPIGRCELTPCSRCQRCISALQDAVQAQLLSSGSTRPSATAIASAFGGACFSLAASAGYDASSACGFVANSYIVPVANSGYFGLRPGAVCSTLGQCASLPTDCRLRTTALAPLLNITGSLDMCSAEGIAGGSALSGVVVATGGCRLWQE